MSVLIKGMKMPTHCVDCVLEEDGYCFLINDVVEPHDKSDNCPLVDVPAADITPKEKPKRILWTGWKGYRDTRYKCPNCRKPVKNDDIYCHRCGQKLMFPHIDFTPYVKGQKQEVIVRWDDEVY